jgi:hypothetical protein
MAINPNTTFTSGAILTAAQMNRLPWGVLGTASTTTAFNTTGTHTTFQDVTGVSASIAYTAGRILRVQVIVNPYTPAALNDMTFQVLRGSTSIREWAINQACLSLSNVTAFCLSHTFSGPGTGATETFKLQVKAGTNTAVQCFASASQPMTMTVEDIGEA